MLGACNALTGVSDFSVCDTCGEDAGPALDAATLDAEARTDTAMPDVERADADADVEAGDPDADTDAGPLIGCQGAVACSRVVFVTSQSYAGNLGGVAGADAKCQALANASSAVRVKGRTFLAWVSTSATSPSARFARGTMPYVGADGSLIASNWTDLTNGNISAGISRDETGALSTVGGAWTGTTSAGATYAGSACTDWTSSAFGTKGISGNVGGNGNGWSSATNDDCTVRNALYCFEK